jgi:hypothetical protein
VPPAPPTGSPGDIWAQTEYRRGRVIQDRLAETDYAGYIETDTLDGFQRAKNFPLIDFISPDHTHSVSVKTYNPFSNAFAGGDTLYDIVDHAQELADYAPGDRVTLDVRVPPNTPPEVMQDIVDTVQDVVGDPRLEVKVSTFP